MIGSVAIRGYLQRRLGRGEPGSAGRLSNASHRAFRSKRLESNDEKRPRPRRSGTFDPPRALGYTPAALGAGQALRARWDP